MNAQVGSTHATSMTTRPFVGHLNIQPPTCRVCGAPHEPEYPHEVTTKFQLHIFRTYYRPVVWSDLWAHTSGLIREGMIANTEKVPLPEGVASWTS